MIKDFGDVAESRFATLCSEAGVTRNSSAQDRTGWDFLVEFPESPVPGLTSDMQSIGHSARVQIKSKHKGRPTVSLKLSNALRFAKEPAPCFVVLFLATDGAEPVRIFARHFWEDEIARTLKRAREAGCHSAAELAKLTLSLSFNSDDDHSTELLPWMEQVIAAHGSRYLLKKKEIVDTVGFEDDAIHGTLSFDVENLPALVDHQIGLTAEAPILRISLNQRRFAIDAPLLPPTFGPPTSIRMQSHPRPCDLRVRGVGGLDEHLSAQAYLPGIPGLPQEQMKLRIVAGCLELIFQPGTNQGSLRITFEGQVRYSLPALMQTGRIWVAAKAGPLDLQVSYEGKLVFGLDGTILDGPALIVPDQVLMATELLMSVTGQRPPEGLTISAREVRNAWKEIVRLHAFVHLNEARLSLILSDLAGIEKPPTCLLAHHILTIGEWTFGAVLHFPITAWRVEGHTAHLSFGPPRIEDVVVGGGKPELWRAELRKRFALAAAAGGSITLEDGDLKVLSRIDPDVEEMLSGPIVAS